MPPLGVARIGHQRTQSAKVRCKFIRLEISVEQGIVIQVNGESRQTVAGTTVSGLLLQLGLNSGRVALEYNLQILPKAKWDETKIADGDRFEIVQFVGGG